MAGVFEDVKLPFAGKEYTIPAKAIMGAIEVIEDRITLHELNQAAANGNIKLAKIAKTYAAVLRYAGAPADVATDEAVYAEIFSGGMGRNVVVSAVMGLLSLMLPPEQVRAKMNASASPGEANRQARRAAASLSRKRTKRRS